MQLTRASVDLRTGKTHGVRAIVLSLCMLLSVVATAAGCGGRSSRSTSAQTSQSQQRSPTSSLQAATTVKVAHETTTAPPWRLTRKPIIVAYLDVKPPLYTVYFRLNRALPRRHNAVIVSLEGAHNYNVSGTGYDDHSSPNCYVWGLDTIKGLPASLRHPRAGRSLKVALHFLRPPGNVVTAKAPPQRALPDEGEPTIANAQRLRQLGCSP